MSDAALEKLRGRLSGGLADASKSRYADILRADDAVERLVAGNWPMEWSAKYYFASDDPLKATLPEQDPGRSVVVQKLVIDCGGLKPSYLGPPESPRMGSR